MNKNAIKKYAIWARRELIERVSQRAMIYGITPKEVGHPDADSVNGHLLSQTEKKQRQALIRIIGEKGYTQVMEEVAYTWFNRFAALRFMEVNGYLPSHVRVFTNDAGEFKPQILAEAIHLELDGLDMKKVYALENENQSEELFKYLLIVQCNALNSILPGMFQRIDDYTELLLPDYLLREGSVVEQLVTTIPEADWTDQVQIIGWLYQYYNTEPKDKVFADLKKNIKITKENIPAATQLFTPDWIVHYMVENSLGRLWLEGHPAAKSKFLPEHNADGSVRVEGGKWNYYLEEAEQEPEVQAQLAEIRKEYAALKPEELRVIDPCCGSGHILCVLFDVLVSIYEDYGITPREAATKIVENNLWGLDIDERAAQLAYFSVMMKARQYDRRFFTRNEHPVQPHVYSPKGYPEGLEYGSLITVDDLEPAPEPSNRGLFDENYSLTLNRWNFRHALCQKYHVVVTNPPYMGNSGMGAKLAEFVKSKYPDSKSDLFACFIERCRNLTNESGYQAMITQHSWMFLSSFENLRKKLQMTDTVNMAHLGARAFEEIGGEVVQTTTFVLKNIHTKDYKGTYCRLIEPTTQQGKEDMFLSGENLYIANQSNFSKIPGSPVAYWINQQWFFVFDKYPVMRDICVLKKGTSTGDNKRFIHQWQEVDITRTSFNARNPEEALKTGCKWFPINGGGERRKWYGNRLDVVNWENDGLEMKALATKLNHGGHWSRYIINPDRFFTECIGWSAISISRITARYVGYGFAFSSAAMEAFDADLKYIMALINSVVAEDILKVLAPTLNFGVEQIGRIPYIKFKVHEVEKITDDCIKLSKSDWDSFETSWDFARHPLLRTVDTIKEAYSEWSQECEDRFNQLKSNEEELNRIFIDIYGLQDELTPEVEDKDVTVRKADLQREIKSLISYAVGCMFGRYSLDKDGLVYAGGEFSDQWLVVNPDRSQKLDVHKSLCYLRDIAENVEITDLVRTHFGVDADNIIPVTDDEYFEDDIVSRFVNFVEVGYGKDTLEENLTFIANALGGKGSSREVIRKYFLNDFFEDHVKIYQKRPIYWLFDSGKKNGFKCLIYMHRYQPDTIARIRTDYVHEQQSRYRTAIADLEQRINGASTGERVKLNKKLTKLQDQATELRLYEEKIHHLADQMIAIDLDDGVKVNYAKFQDVLAKVK